MILSYVIVSYVLKYIVKISLGHFLLFGTFETGFSDNENQPYVYAYLLYYQKVTYTEKGFILKYQLKWE